MLDEVANGILQFDGAAVDAAADLFFGESGEPTFDQVQPRGRSRREVQVKARPFGQPAPDQLGFVGAIVVQDEMDLEFLRHVAVNGVEKLAELARAMAAMQLAQHTATGDIESGKQAGSAVALVIMAAALDLSRTHRQQGRGTVQRLNLALLVYAQHQRTIRRIQVETNNVANFIDKQWIAA